jgi:MoxR-like ATPase
VADEIYDYLMAIVEATRQCPDFEFGASPRAALALLRAAQARAMIEARDYCVPDDVKALVHPVLDHRMIRHGGSSASRDGGPEKTLDRILHAVPVPL